MASLEGKVIAITGAVSGIGLALTKLAASHGAKLALADIQKEALEKLVSELHSSGVDAVGTCLNVSAYDGVRNWIESTVQHFGRIDGAANVAAVEGKKGAGVLTELVDLSNDEWDDIIAINLTGLMYCLRAQLQVMGNGGSVVNVASTAGTRSRPGMSAYSASKHGVIGLSRTAARETGPKGIRVNAVAPYVYPLSWSAAWNIKLKQ